MIVFGRTLESNTDFRQLEVKLIINCDIFFSGDPCKDPGRPPDGKLIPVDNSFERGKKVEFSCDRPGFELNDSSPIVCDLSPDGTRLEWNGTVPRCVGELHVY